MEAVHLHQYVREDLLRLLDIARARAVAAQDAIFKLSDVQRSDEIVDDCSEVTGGAAAAGETCSICLEAHDEERLRSRVKVWIRLRRCRHVMHRRCLIDWFDAPLDAPTCPLCRDDVRPACADGVCQCAMMQREAA
jgi:hypothetical protein